MKGVQFLVDEDGNKTAVLIDLKRNAELWENFYDLALARARKSEPRESLDTVKRRLRAAKSRTNGRVSNRLRAVSEKRARGLARSHGVSHSRPN
jgi:hypothetical protein